MRDKVVESLIKKEEKRQRSVINLIASENYVSQDVLRSLGSVFTNKYAEGYSKLRYYGGNEVVDALEDLTKKRALQLFGLSNNPPSANWRSGWHVNVQPYSGSPANLAVYMALVPVGGKIMGLRLNMGGHLTHGHSVSATGKLWKQVAYGVDKKTEKIDYKALMRLAKKEKPALIVAGFTAYSRKIDFKAFRRIADAGGAILMVDMSHIAGLIAAGVHSSPFPYADVVTTTIHKTLRGPRAAVIFCKKEYAKAVDKAVFPGLQGGPHGNAIAATSVALWEASKSSFKTYARQVVKNAKALAARLKKQGFRIVSGGTDTHLFLVDTMSVGISGKEASDRLEHAGIIVNKNTIPYDSRSPMDPSGIRIGTPAITTQGMKEREMKVIANFIFRVLIKKESPTRIRKEVLKFVRKFKNPV